VSHQELNQQNPLLSRGGECFLRSGFPIEVAYSTHMKTQQTRREFIGLAAAAVAAPFVQRESSPRRITTLVGVVTDNVTLNNPFGLVIGPDGALYWVE